MATLIINNIETKKDVMELKYKEELEKSTILLLLHSIEENAAEGKSNEIKEESPPQEKTPVNPYNDTR